jgi:hypothetical protein
MFMNAIIVGGVFCLFALGLYIFDQTKVGKRFFGKNTTRSVAQVGDYLSCSSCLCKHVFVEQRERLTNNFLPALFCAEALQ